MRFTAKIVPYSGIVGTGVMLMDETGACAAILGIQVPDPERDYREVANEVADQIAAAFNGEQSGTEKKS